MMNEMLLAFVVSLILGVYYLSHFDKVIIFISVGTLLMVYYTIGLDEAVVDIDGFLLWVILFYMLVTCIISISRPRDSTIDRN